MQQVIESEGKCTGCGKITILGNELCVDCWDSKEGQEHIVKKCNIKKKVQGKVFVNRKKGIIDFVNSNPNRYTFTQIAKIFKCTRGYVRIIAVDNNLEAKLFIISDIIKKDYEG